ncbi:protein FAM204A [Spea bombifrons]|uniref:protein FAM204A n=1 Tax=Spea bombifrons TaxID=233779 RepID=UPI00234B5C7A|nr:protein FAM204A [Spea bombifrons]
MWSGLLPPGVRESDVSEEEEPGRPIIAQEAAGGSGEEEPGTAKCPAGVPETCYNKFLDLRRRRMESETSARGPETRKRRRKGKCKEKPSGNPGVVGSSALDTLQQYFGANDRFEPPVCNKVIKKSRLEDGVDRAIRMGDIEVAEELSDQLATREMAVKVTRAASCHNYLKAKQEEEATQASQRKKRNLGWGFEAKKRWETKSNMGYM